MALERETIEKKDFPVGRRGYDPSAVDAHLQAIAAEVDELKRSNRQRPETLATGASEQVRAIIEAAETSGAEIRREAEEEAREIRAGANRDAKREREEAARAAQTEREEASRAAQTEREQAASEAQRQRDEASVQAREYVDRVSDLTSQMLGRLQGMETELGTLTESLRTGASRLTAELELVESEMRDLSSFAPAGGAEAATAAVPVEEESSALTEAQPELALNEALEEESETAVIEDEPVADAERAEAEAAAEALPAAEVQPRAEEEVPAEGAKNGDAEGARLIALNMALNGTPREETDRYLAENFEIPNRGQLLDEVYASVER